nr:PREDICTED: protein NDR1-like [Daucus carota subsp. sativus]
MAATEDAKNAKLAIAQCVCGWTMFFLYVPPWIWLILNTVNQTSISLSLEDFMIADVQSSNVSALNQTLIYFKLHIEDTENDLSVHYENLSLGFSYYRGSDNIVQLGNYTILRFHQDAHDKTHPQASVVLKQGLSWQEISRNATSVTVAFRVDLAGVVRFSEFNVESKKLKMMAGAKVEVDPVTGRRISKKAVGLKHMIKHHQSGSVTFFLVFMIIATIFAPLWLSLS